MSSTHGNDHQGGPSPDEGRRILQRITHEAARQLGECAAEEAIAAACRDRIDALSEDERHAVAVALLEDEIKREAEAAVERGEMVRVLDTTGRRRVIYRRVGGES
jgi:hypothetical protein